LSLTQICRLTDLQSLAWGTIEELNAQTNHVVPGDDALNAIWSYRSREVRCIAHFPLQIQAAWRRSERPALKPQRLTPDNAEAINVDSK
jgi:hypothetical protein